MHFYQKNILDFNNATRHLTRIERSLFSDAIELYYDTEKPLTSDFEKLVKILLATSEEEKIALKSVLDEFFTLTKKGYFNKRCNKEIERYRKLKKEHWTVKLTKEQRAAFAGERNASKVNATPKWLTKEHRKEIASIYAKSAILTASSGIKHEVDHIIPLRSKVVCGLHVPWNLRVIEAYKNRAKSNLFEVG